MAGAMTVGIPEAMLCGITTQAKETAVSQAQAAEAELAEKTSTWIYVLDRNMHAGDEVTEEDLKSFEVLTDSQTFSTVTDKTQIIGKRLKCDLNKNSVLQSALLYEGAELTDDERLVRVDYSTLPADINAGSQIDLRIFFPDGEDFVVLSKKKVEEVNRNEDGEVIDIKLRLDEKELLLLAGAYVDCKEIEGCNIYALSYVSETQKAAAVNYPVNEAVYELLGIDPNVSSGPLSETTTDRRKLLEDHLFTDDEKGVNAGGSDSDRSEILNLFE